MKKQQLTKTLFKLFGLMFLTMMVSSCIPKVSDITIKQPLSKNQTYKGVNFDVTGTDEVNANEDFQATADAVKSLLVEKALKHQNLGLTESANPTIIVEIVVNQFRFVSAGARIGAGVGAGEAILGGTISLFDQSNRNKLGEYEFLEKSGTQQGIMSDKTSNQEEILANKVISILEDMKT